MSFPSHLRDSESALRESENALAFLGHKLSPELSEYVKKIVRHRLEIAAWLEGHQIRENGLQLLRQLDQHADQNDRVTYQGHLVQFSQARMLLVQGYLAATWSLADRVSVLLSKLYALEEISRNPIEQARLMTNFFHLSRKKGTEGSAAKVGGLSAFLLKHSFGWPMAISYCARNIFLHEGGHLRGEPLFKGNRAVDGFAISDEGIQELQFRAEVYCDCTHNRIVDAWPWSPHDLRELLGQCHRELDNALGFLLVTGCETLKIQLRLLLGD